MKKNYIMLAALCLLAVLALSGCKKNSGSAKSKTELLTQLSWKMEAFGADLDKNGSIDLNQMEDCHEDNILTINANGTGTLNEGADVCDGSEATEDFTWAFKSNETIVNIDIDVIGEVYILTLTDVQLKVYKDVDPGTGTPIRALFVFKH